MQNERSSELNSQIAPQAAAIGLKGLKKSQGSQRSFMTFRHLAGTRCREMYYSTPLLQWKHVNVGCRVVVNMNGGRFVFLLDGREADRGKSPHQYHRRHFEFVIEDFRSSTLLEPSTLPGRQLPT